MLLSSEPLVTTIFKKITNAISVNIGRDASAFKDLHTIEFICDNRITRDFVKACNENNLWDKFNCSIIADTLRNKKDVEDCVESHRSAKGSNSYIGKEVLVVVRSLGKLHDKMLSYVLNSFGINGDWGVKMFYYGMIIQAVGRNLMFRAPVGSNGEAIAASTTVLINPIVYDLVRDLEFPVLVEDKISLSCKYNTQLNEIYKAIEKIKKSNKLVPVEVRDVIQYDPNSFITLTQMKELKIKRGAVLAAFPYATRGTRKDKVTKEKVAIINGVSIKKLI
jgi:hypothetical protein